MYIVNVSSIQDFMQCRFRWWCKWVMNRVPLNEGAALGAGKLLHLIFEDASKGTSIDVAARDRLAEWNELLEKADPASQANGYKAIQIVRDLEEAFPLWQDKFKMDETLEVEEPFESELLGIPDILWRGRPDRVAVSMDRVWHIQHRGLAASTNFGTYMTLAQRHYHEHLYAEHLARKYCTKKLKGRKKVLKYGGTVFDLVRKLKYRTNVGKKNEATKTAEEMFFQQAMSINLKSGLHQSVMMSAVQHVREMERVLAEWEINKVIPPPNEKMNGGFSGNMIDPYFRVLTGEIKLSNDNVFKNREDMYAEATETESA